MCILLHIVWVVSPSSKHNELDKVAGKLTSVLRSVLDQVEASYHGVNFNSSM